MNALILKILLSFLFRFFSVSFSGFFLSFKHSSNMFPTLYNHKIPQQLSNARGFADISTTSVFIVTLFSGITSAWSQSAIKPNEVSTEKQSEPAQVTIKAKIQPAQTLIDRKVYNVANDLQATTGSAADILNTLPSVDVDADGNVSLRGNGKVMILIDGRPSAQLSGSKSGDGLLQFAANNIEKIEVMTNAPAEYGAEGTGGVINLITKKGRTIGSSGSVSLNEGNFGRYVIGANGAFNTEQLNLSGGFGLRHDVRERLVTSSLAATDATAEQTKSQDQRHEIAYRLIPSLNGTMRYQFNDQQSLSADVNFKQRSGDRYFDQQSQRFLSDDSLIGSTTTHSDGYEWSLSGEQRLRFKQNLGRAEESIEVSLHRSTDKERERYAYLRSTSVPASGQSRDHLFLNHDLRVNELSVDYRTVLANDQRLKLGYNFKYDRNEFENAGDTVDPLSGQVLPNADLTNQFRYQQAIQAFYGSYEQMLGKWASITGIRSEHTAIKGNQLTTNILNQQRYMGFYPSQHFEHPLDNDATLSVGLSRRLSRPDPEDLNPFIDHQDVHNLRAGNPNLLPQDVQSLDVTYRAESKQQSYGLTGYLRQSRDNVTDVTVLVSPDVLLATKTNLPKSNSGGMEFNLSDMVTSSIAYRLSGNLFYSQINAIALGASSVKSSAGLNLKASIDYRPTQFDNAQISVSRTDKRLTPQGFIKAINLVNFGYKRQLDQDLSLVFTVSDMFNGQRFQRYVNSPDLVQTYQRHQFGRIAYLGFSYAFGASRKNKNGGFEYDQ